MKRGQTLIELVVAIAILAVVVPVSLRLLFAMDWAVTEQAEQAESIGNVAELLEDVGADLRAARKVNAVREKLRLWSRGQVYYYWDGRELATVRQTVGAKGEMRIYPGARANFQQAGNMVRVRISAGEITLRTAFYLRNR